MINAINPQSGKLYFDATFGWGGYSEKLLDTCACKVIAIDQDPSVKDKASELKKNMVIDLILLRVNLVKLQLY